jgi:hypothetical protein
MKAPTAATITAPQTAKITFRPREIGATGDFSAGIDRDLRRPTTKPTIVVPAMQPMICPICTPMAGTGVVRMMVMQARTKPAPKPNVLARMMSAVRWRIRQFLMLW